MSAWHIVALVLGVLFAVWLAKLLLRRAFVALDKMALRSQRRHGICHQVSCMESAAYVAHEEFPLCREHAREHFKNEDFADFCVRKGYLRAWDATLDGGKP